jgi:hypothetical protein
VGGVQDGPVFDYALHALPPGRVGFRRWRWELWEGALLLASGWRVTPHDAERALRTAASRRAHERIGVRALRPDQARAVGRFVPGRTMRVDCGAVACVLVPRGDDRRSAAA